MLGRTGTFCAIFTILDRFKVEQVIDVLQTVKLLRIKRPGIVEDLVSFYHHYLQLYNVTRFAKEDFIHAFNFSNRCNSEVATASSLSLS